MIGRPAKRIVGDPEQTVVGVLPVAVRVREVARLRRHEHPTVRFVVVPGAVRIELIVEDIEIPDDVTADVDVDVEVPGLVVVDRLRRWRNGAFEQVLGKGRFLAQTENAGALFAD